MTPTPSIAQGLTISDLLRGPGLSPPRLGEPSRIGRFLRASARQGDGGVHRASAADAEDGDRSHRSVRQVIPDPTP